MVTATYLVAEAAGPDSPPTATGPTSRAPDSAAGSMHAPHVLAVTAGDTPRAALLADRLRAAGPAAIAAVVDFWGDDWPTVVDVEVATDDADFADRVAAGSDGAADPHLVDPGAAASGRWDGVAAVTVADAVDVGRRLAPGRRIVVAAGADRLSSASLHIVLTHEVMHYAARADTAPAAPGWLTEGVADLVARPAEPPPADARAVLPSDAELAATDPVRRADAYDRAWWFARFVEARFGAPALRAYTLAVAGASARDPGEAAADLLDDWPTLMRRWKAWLILESAAR